MNKALILFAHPRYEKSRANRALISALSDLEQVTVHDLYETYPDFNIDANREQLLLQEHQIIVWHFPLYMYSAPAMLKQWMDLVLEHGWAHGGNTYSLKNRLVFCAITTGGTRASYAPGAFNSHSMGEFLYPFQQTAHLCRMNWLPPFMLQGTYRLSEQALAEYAADYRQALHLLGQACVVSELQRFEFINDWLQFKEGAVKHD